MKIGKLLSLYDFIKNIFEDSNVVYVETEKQKIFGIRTVFKIDEYNKKIINSFPDIEIFEYEIGYCKEWDKIYMNIKKEIESEADFFGTLIFGKDELILEKNEIEILKLDYVDSNHIEEYMSDNDI